MNCLFEITRLPSPRKTWEKPATQPDQNPYD